jgi:hypothetical protein
VVLLVLAIVWAVLLVSWLRSRGGGTFYDSVGTFRRHLTVLERAAPVTVTPANRLRNGPTTRGRVAGPSRPTALRTGYSPRPSTGLRPPSAAARRRRQSQKRRRDVFFVLVAGVVGTFALAMIPGLGIMWSVQVAFDVLLVGYIALLMRMRNLAAERELKLRFMPEDLRRGQARPAYDLGGASYGELSMRRAAN